MNDVNKRSERRPRGTNGAMRAAGVIVVTLTLGVAVSASAQDGQEPAGSLSAAQVAVITQIKTQAEQKAGPLALRLSAIVSRLYDNNLSDTPDPTVRAALDAEMKEAVWQLLAVKGDSMWAAFGALTPAQKRVVRTEVAKPRQPGDLPDVLALIDTLFKPAPR